MSGGEALWRERATMAVDRDGDLRRVLDPADRRGLKNGYIDLLLKRLLLDALRPNPGDIVVELGSGIGRLTEFLAPRVAQVCGVERDETFVAACRRRAGKAVNSRYVTPAEAERDGIPPCGKGFMVWTGMYFREDRDLTSTLARLRRAMAPPARFVLIEQVAAADREVDIDGSFYCRYRTPDRYARILERAGFRPLRRRLARERRYGPFYRGMFNRFAYPLLPSWIAPALPWLVAFDALVLAAAPPLSLPVSGTPLDCVIVAEAAS